MFIVPMANSTFSPKYITMSKVFFFYAETLSRSKFLHYCVLLFAPRFGKKRRLIKVHLFCCFSAFTVEKIDGIRVSIYGLGPFNGIVRRILRSILRRHLREYLEKEGRDVVQQELQAAALASEGDNLFTLLPQLVLA